MSKIKIFKRYIYLDITLSIDGILDKQYDLRYISMDLHNKIVPIDFTLFLLDVFTLGSAISQTEGFITD